MSAFTCVSTRLPALSLLATALLLSATALQAAPGELDPAFNAELGYATFLAPAGAAEPSAGAVCVDPLGRVAVAASLQTAVAPALWRPQLLRTSAAGVPDPSFGAGFWFALGSSAGDPQIPAIRCDSDRYVVASIAGPSAPYAVRLDQVPSAGAGGGAFSQILNAGLLSYQPRVALAAVAPGNWWVGAAVMEAPMFPSVTTGTLQRWSGATAPLTLTATATGVEVQYNHIVDAVTTPGGQLFAVSRYLFASDYRTAVHAFQATGQPVNGFGFGGTAGIDTPQHDYGNRIALSSTGGKVYIGMTQLTTGLPLISSARVLRLLADGSVDNGFAGGSWQVVDAEMGDLIEDGQGRLLIAGRRNGAAFVTRLLANGAPDLSFGPAGERVFGFGSTAARFDGITLDEQGRIVLAGTRFAAQRGGATIPAAVIVARVLP